MSPGAIIPKITASYSSVDCIVAVYIFFKIRALTSDSEFRVIGGEYFCYITHSLNQLTLIRPSEPHV